MNNLIVGCFHTTQESSQRFQLIAFQAKQVQEEIQCVSIPLQIVPTSTSSLDSLLDIAGTTSHSYKIPI